MYYPQSLTVGQQVPWAFNLAINRLVRRVAQPAPSSDPYIQEKWADLGRILKSGTDQSGNVTPARWAEIRPNLVSQINIIGMLAGTRTSGAEEFNLLTAVKELRDDLVVMVDAAVPAAQPQQAPQLQPQQPAKSPWVPIGGGLVVALVVGLVLFLVLRKK